MQIGLLGLFSFSGLLRTILNKSDPIFFHIFVIYSLLLLLPTYFRGEFSGLFYGLKDYVIPATLLLGFSYFIPKHKIKEVFYYVSIICGIVSIIYFSEFVSKNILFSGYFSYTDGIRVLSEATGADGIAESSFEGGLSSFFRLPGPLSHNNATGLAIAVGALATMPLLQRKRSIIIKAVFAICLITLLVSGARTAWIAFMLSALFYYREKRTIWITFVVVIVFCFWLLVYFLPAFIGTINIETLLNTAFIIFSEFENFDGGRIYNLVIGSGYNYPGMKTGYSSNLNPLLNDDLFIIQLATIYGVLPLLMFAYCIFSMKTIPKVDPDYVYINAANAILICFAVSAMHTNALIRPQLYPIFFLFIVAKHLLYKSYKENKV
tara:strand:+ start:1687 stop:2820 length:1134 start_codon:yes stop_codon:yes gene_type:complete